jgi:hypothetical protein
VVAIVYQLLCRHVIQLVSLANNKENCVILFGATVYLGHFCARKNGKVGLLGCQGSALSAFRIIGGTIARRSARQVRDIEKLRIAIKLPTPVGVYRETRRDGTSSRNKVSPRRHRKRRRFHDQTVLL